MIGYMRVLLNPCVSQPPRRVLWPPMRVGEVDGDELHAGLDQPAGEQAALAVGVPAVGVAEPLRLGRQVERLAQTAARSASPAPGRNSRRCPRAAAEWSSRRRLLVDQLQQLAAVVEPLERQVRRQAQLRQRKSAAVGVLR